ncbi:hypothetical protein [Paractinoplanes lichenicola]|uniref:HEAT repeat domain-containing protein n=1 Tax=Paractinoplanes lichenicola TaxID=2802976 RepID=A0ABS1VY76_9ACTN|nr:hypothetical protein [Actinoplanes lichenicola]MBL7259451.1 hypothetical protein [Actinoplanes lichenicola]
MLKSTGDLLASLDPFPYGVRMARVAAWARTAPDRAEVCAELRAAGPYERSLALTAAQVTSATDEVRLALTDPDAALRARALQSVLTTAELDLDRPVTERRLIYRTLRRVDAPAAADALLPRVREAYGDQEAAALLPACGAEVVRAALPGLDHATNLTAVARRHPAVLLAHLTAQLEAADPERAARIWARAGHAVLHCDPAGVLDLLERHGPETYLPGNLPRYGVLAAHDPRRVAALLAAAPRANWIAHRPLPRALTSRLAALPDAELLPLAQRVRDGSGYANLLAALPPSRRAALHNRTVGSAGSTLDPLTMELLPHAVREDEARRQMTRPFARGNESVMRALSAYLPWPEARDAIVQATGSGDAAERANAYAKLIDAARRSRDPEAVTEALGLLGRLRNEQDPVRSTVLLTLAHVAPLLTPATADRLTRLTTDAVEARDASAQSLAALSALAVRVLQQHVDEPALRDWALLTIDLTAAGKSVPMLGRFDRTLRRGQEVMVFDRLRGWAEAGMDRGFFEPLFALTRALGKRAWNVDGLQALLRSAIAPGNVPSVHRTAAELWLADPRARPVRVAEVLDVDPSIVAESRTVWRTLCGSRTDLLDRVLNRTPRGRFLKEGVRWVPPWPDFCERWLPRQQAVFVQLHERIADDTGATRHQRAASIQAAARVPVLGSAIALRYAESSDVVLAEAALGALVWTDRPEQALATLLAHAGDDRARVAMYAAGRAARFVPPSRLPALLDPILLGRAKVTSRKEAARLLSQFGPPASMGTLMTAYGTEGQHRDVRAALIAAARARLWAAESWTILEAGIAGSREERQAVLAGKPGGMAERYRARFAALVDAACRSDDQLIRAVAFALVPDWAPWLGDVTGLVVDRLTDLDAYLNRYETAALVGTLHAGGLETVWQRLTDADATDDPGSAERDRPWRERLDDLADAVDTWAARADPAVDRGPALTAARSLADRDGFLTPALKMMVALGGSDVLDEVADRCADRPIVAYHAAQTLTSYLTRVESMFDAGAQLVRATDFEQRGGLAHGLFAVALTRRGYRLGWPVEWRDRLRSLRRHPDPDVRDAATAVVMTW